MGLFDFFKRQRKTPLSAEPELDLMPWIVELEFENDHCVGVKEYDLFRKTCLERL